MFTGGDGSGKSKCSCNAYMSQSTRGLRALLKEHVSCIYVSSVLFILSNQLVSHTYRVKEFVPFCMLKNNSSLMTCLYENVGESVVGNRFYYFSLINF